MTGKKVSALIKPGSPTFSRYRGLLVLSFFFGLGLLYLAIPNIHLILREMVSTLAMADVRELKELVLSFGWWAPVISFLLMILQTLIAPLPAFVLAIANSMAFGMFYGFVLTCISALAAAFTAFFLARWLGRSFLERKLNGRILGRFDSIVERFGAWGVLILRLFPIISFDFVSYAAGLTAMRARNFGIATFFGMLPATIAYSLLGDSLESANRWALFSGLGLLAVLFISVLCMRQSAIWRNLNLNITNSGSRN